MAFSSMQGSIDFDAEMTLSDKLKVFKSNNFNPQSYFHSNSGGTTEKDIRQLCMHLERLKKASAEEMRKSVYANYASFIRTSREISDLEGELVSLKNLLSSRANIIHGIADGVRIESLPDGTDHAREAADLEFEDSEPPKYDKWLSQFMEKIEVLLAERRIDEALAILDEGEVLVEEARETKSMTIKAILSLEHSIMVNRQKLADQLADATCQASTNGFELRAAVQSMKKIGDGPRAHTLLLKSHQQKLHRNMQSLQPSSTTYGPAYTTALAHLVFSTIAQASNDSLTIFDDEPAFTSELVTWAVNQTLAFAQLIKRNVVATPAASGCLRIVAECIHICLGHSLLLEDRGLALWPTVLNFFKPFLEQALTTTLKKIDLCTAALAASEDWSLCHSPIAGRSWGSASASMVTSHQKLSNTAHRFHTMIQELCEDIGSLEILHLSEQALEGVLQSFNAYVSLLVNALPSSMDADNLEGSGRRIVGMAETETQQVALLANAVLLADELLPRATIKLCSTIRGDDPQQRDPDRKNRPPEQRELKKRLQRSVEQLRDSFCRQHALELIVTEDGGVHLSAEMYISMDENKEEPEWFPSPIYQELFAKLTRLGSIASDVFVGRERFATILLMRLTETVILWFSEDQNFWDEIEGAQRPLGPLGLQQFYLDMEFVILFASQGRYLSRNLHQVMKNVIARAIEAVKANNIDPYSVLPEDEWFADVAQIAIKMLLGQANFDNPDHDITSPTASMSARSVSSVHSHGSQ
ncbi:exocyst complex component EXO84A-like [Salvia divinorum]|uniref:Exocyst complex component EXO84A-like n=1 Tax=Salvia divinorum TaxID=28513 RepID=A0ABD1IMK8_SALDI